MKFPAKLYNMASNDATGSIWWNADGDAVVVDIPKFEQHYLATGQFKTAQIGSLVRQLNLYSFVQVGKTIKIRHSDDVSDEVISQLRIYKAPLFRRDRPDLLRRVRRGIVGDGRHPNGELCTCRGDCKMKRKRKRGPNKPKTGSSGDEQQSVSYSTNDIMAANEITAYFENNADSIINIDFLNTGKALPPKCGVSTPGLLPPKLSRMASQDTGGVESLKMVKRWRAQAGSSGPYLDSPSPLSARDGSQAPRRQTVTAYGRVATAFATSSQAFKGTEPTHSPSENQQTLIDEGVATGVTIGLDGEVMGYDDGGARMAIREVHLSLSESRKSFLDFGVENGLQERDPMDDVEYDLYGDPFGAPSVVSNGIEAGSGGSNSCLPVETIGDPDESLISVISGIPSAVFHEHNNSPAGCSAAGPSIDFNDLSSINPHQQQCAIDSYRHDSEFPFSGTETSSTTTIQIVGLEEDVKPDVKPIVSELDFCNNLKDVCGSGSAKGEQQSAPELKGTTPSPRYGVLGVSTRARSKRVANQKIK